jgi:hypothetical protein
MELLFFFFLLGAVGIGVELRATQDVIIEKDRYIEFQRAIIKDHEDTIIRQQEILRGLRFKLMHQLSIGCEVDD